MEIKNNINSNNLNRQNFNGIYRIKSSNIDDLKVVSDSVIPMYSFLRRRGAVAFLGDNPVEVSLIKVLSDMMDRKGLSYEWLSQNAKMHGLHFADKNNSDMWVMTGDDVDIVEKAVSWQIKDYNKPDLKFKFKLFKDLVWGKYSKLPEHLKDFILVFEKNKKMTSFFNSQVRNKDILEAQNVQDLLTKMTCEK